MVAVFTGSGLGLERGSSWVLGAYSQLGSASFGRFGENVSVNAATGNLVISRTDEIVIGKGPDDVLTRTYNSFRNSGQYQNPYNHMGTYNADGIQGDDWQLNASRRIVISGTKGTSGSTVTLYD